MSPQKLPAEDDMHFDREVTSNGAPHWQRMPVSNGVAIVRTNGARPAILIRTGPVLQGWAGIGHDSLRAFPISAVIFRAAHRIRVRV